MDGFIQFNPFVKSEHLARTAKNAVKRSMGYTGSVEMNTE